MATSDETKPLPSKPVLFIASSRRDLRELPKSVRKTIGQALRSAQRGQQHDKVKPLKGFAGGGVLEVVESFVGNAYRAVYTVKFRDAVYVLHVFQKKSKSGTATPIEDIEKIRSRLKIAEGDYEERIEQQERSHKE